jgi:anti-anti-sigma factor
MTFRWPRAAGGPRGESGDGRVAPDRSPAIAVGRCLGTVVVTVGGPLDTLAATRLAAALGDLIDGQGNLAVAVDLGDVPRIAPPGEQVLAAAACNLERRGGRLSLCEARGSVLGALEHAGLTRCVTSPHAHDAEAATSGTDFAALRSRRPPASHPAGSGRQLPRQDRPDDQT